jgi:membrane protease YdiL (CAAX protease family)
MLQRLRELEGPAVFVIVTVALTLVSTAVCIPAAERIELDASAMLRASIIYVAVVGWQPLVAFAIARRWFADDQAFDHGVHPVSLRESIFAVIVAVFVLLVAAVAEVALVHRAAAGEPPHVVAALPWLKVARLLIAFAAIIAILWLQAIVEELTWRGYVLPRLMRTLGAWPGLAAHGLLWGLSYSPLFAFAGGSMLRSLGYVVTCGLLGIVLGWLRLSSRSIYASAASNATLTIGAGLPLLLIGETSRFSAAFEPVGWAPLLFVIALIAWHRPSRAAVVTPLRP